MKKRVLSLLLTLCMLLTLFPAMGITASAVSEIEVSSDLQSEINNAASGDTLKLMADITENITIPAGKKIIIDLNGFVLKSAAYGKPVITVGAENDTTAELTINDTNSTATHSADYADLPAGGIITGGNNNTNNSNGGGICNYGTLTMNGGTVAKNEITGTNGTGGGVYNQGTFTMNTGAVITCNESTGNGGGVSNKGSFIMNGGSITNNKALNGTNGGAGGGVYSEKTFEMYGGKISGNSCGTAYGGGVDYSSGNMTLGGTAVIKENSPNNLFNEENMYVTISTGEKAPVADKMHAGVTLKKGTGAVTTASNADYTSYFTSDNTAYAVYNNGKDSSQQVCIGNIEAVNIDTGVYYDTVSAAFANVDNNQTIQLLKDVGGNIDVSSESDKCITLDLNGYVLSPKTKDESVISIYGTSSLTITDSRPTAKHEGSYDTLPDGGIITGCESESGAIRNSATLIMIGGTITGNRLGVNNMCNYWCDNWNEVPPSLYLTGGFLYIGGTAKITGNQDVYGKVNNVYLGKDSAIGADDNEYPIKTTITIGTKTATSEGNGVAAPAEGMSIGVTLADGTGAFTSNGAKKDEAYFFSDNASYSVKYNNATTEDASDDYLELVTSYTITCADCTNGSVSVGNQTPAYEGKEVTVTITPAEGYELDTLTVKDADSADVTVNGNKFIMPAKNVTVSATFKQAHIHSWTYTLSNNNQTVTAECTGSGTCGYSSADKTLTIYAPSNPIYNGGSHNASFGEAQTFLGGQLPAITYEYKATRDGTYASTSENKVAGYYKASFTVGTGEGAKTACIEYTVAKAKVTVPAANTGLTFNGNEQIGVDNPAAGAKYTLSDNKKTDAGDYTATAKLNDTANYVWDLTAPTSEAQSIPWSIAQATQTASAPSEAGKTATTVTLNAAAAGSGDTLYAWNTENTAPSGDEKWQSGTGFTGLTQDTDYYFFAKYTGDGNHASAVSEGTCIRTAAHAHSWVYSLKEGTTDTIVARCNGEGVCNYGSTDYELKISYNETEKKIKLSASTLAGEPVPAVKYEKLGNDLVYSAPTETEPELEGHYRASVTIGGKTASTEFDFIVDNTAMTLSLMGDIGVNFYLDVDYYLTEAEKNDAYVLLTYNHNTKSYSRKLKTDKLYVKNAWHDTSDNTYKFSASVVSGQMSDEIKIELYSGTGRLVYTKVSSISDYCQRVISAYKELPEKAKFVELCKTILDYGSSAQTYFKYNESNLANGGIYYNNLSSAGAEGIPAFSFGSQALNDGTSFMALSQSAIRFYYTGSVTVSGITCTNSSIAVRTGSSGQGKYIEVYNIPGADLDLSFTVQTDKGDITGCALSFVHKVLASSNEAAKAMCGALLLYNAAADAYFAR